MPQREYKKKRVQKEIKKWRFRVYLKKGDAKEKQK